MENHKSERCSKTHSLQNWILFPVEDLRQVETAKRILTKEKLDRQLIRQYSSTPFIGIRDGHNRKVSFDTKELGDKIDKLCVMIGKLATETVKQVGGSNHKFIKIEAEVRTEITIRETIRTGIDQIVVTEDNTDKTEVTPRYEKKI